MSTLDGPTRGHARQDLLMLELATASCVCVQSKWALSGMQDWFQGKRILLVEGNYMVASRLETEVLHHNAIPVGPAGSVGDALNLMLSTRIDAAILDVDLMTENSLPLADVLVRRGTPFVFISKQPTNWVPTRYRDLLLNKPPNLSAVARLFAQQSEAREDNVIALDDYRSREPRGDKHYE